MALHRSSLSRRGSKNESEKDDDESENNGYIQVFVKPLEQGNCSLILSWLGLDYASLCSQHAGVVYGVGLAVSGVCAYQVYRHDVGALFQRLCALLVPMFSIVCAFYWLSLYFRKSWSTTSVYLLFSSCYVGETLAQLLSSGGAEREGLDPPVSEAHAISQPLAVFIVLLSVSTSSIFSTLATLQSAMLILLVSFTRFLACTNLLDLPVSIRPYVSYSCGFAGIIVSKYMETIFKPPVNNYMTPDGKIPVIKRRRSSSSNAHPFSAHRSARRTSLPALIHKQSSATSYESAIISEAHGLITDMLADSTLPLHIVSGLRAVSNLLKPPDTHTQSNKTKVSPLVSLTECTTYGSDADDLPYTGERPSSLPKRLRHSLPKSLLRRMSTSTWTTTTSATGMPTLEAEPCRIRSSSFRHNRDGTPNSSPAGSRSNSPSPSSPTTVTLSIPKSRSYSVTTPSSSIPNSHYQKRLSQKSVYLASPGSEFNSANIMSKADSSKDIAAASFKRLNMTSDYESNDSPSSSDHSDNVNTSDELVGSPPKKLSAQADMNLPTINKTHLPVIPVEDRSSETEDFAEQEELDEAGSADKTAAKGHWCAPGDDSQVAKELPYNIESIDSCQLLHISLLNDWDYPIFDLADTTGDTILSKVAYKLFQEVGLFESFRIPLPQFIHYFHALEMGYQDKPYHNRVHATDVLHGVFYLTTQAIPGFQNICTSELNRHGSSKSEYTDRSSLPYRSSFLAEDTYGIMGGNFPALELMALYTASAMHDYDHPGRTNAFLVATHAPQAVLYNDRSVLENHHAAAAWNLFMSHPQHNFLTCLDKAEFKRFRFLVIEAILATDLKRHFEILAEFNAKVNVEDAPGLDWSQETDRLLAMQMVIKMADINGPAKKRDLHTAWTTTITEEFYEQGDDEVARGMPISPYMDRRNPQLSKLQESFINHLVAPLCNAMATGGLIPGSWVEDDSDGEGYSDGDKADSTCKDTEDDTDAESGPPPMLTHKYKKTRKVNCMLTKNLKENHEYWVAKIKEEDRLKAAESVSEIELTKVERTMSSASDKPEMEPITEEVEISANFSDSWTENLTAPEKT